MEQFAPWLKFYDNISKSHEYPKMNLWEAVRRIACKYPQYTALIYMNRKITYKEMTERIDCVQSGLRKCGVKKGDRVIVSLPNTPQAVYLLYALNSIGAVACFVHPLSAFKEIAEYIKITQSNSIVMLDSFYSSIRDKDELFKNKTIILTTPEDELEFCKRKLYSICHRKTKAHIEDRVYLWRDIMKNSQEIESETDRVSADSPAVVLFSGGTTGKPKGVLISSYGLNAMAVQTAQAVGCSITGTKLLAVMPVFHGFGLGVSVHAVLMHGGCSVLVPRFNAEKTVKIIKKHRPNFIAGVPTMYEALTRCKHIQGVDLSFLKGVFSGGDKLTEKLREKLDGYLKEHGASVKIREGYGLTECVAVSCLTPDKLQRKGSVGIPFPSTYYKICKVGSTQELTCGQVGEICISGPSLMLGYLDDEVETKKVLKMHGDGRRWLHTGDAGTMDKDGFVYFKQRIKHIIVTSGYNVYPSQIEKVLNEHPYVCESCVVGVPDQYKMQIIKAYVVCKEGCSDEKTKTELLELCRENLARYAVPSLIELVECLPLTELNKIDYKSLKMDG